VRTLRGAITLLGVRQVASIAAGIACKSLFDVEVRVQHTLYPHFWARLFHQSMTVGFASAFFAMEHGRAPGDTFLGGMLHGIGKTLALRSLATLITSGVVPGVPSDAALTALLRKVHVGFGARAHRVFGLPEPLLEICQRQRDLEVPAGRAFRDLHVVRVISGLDELRVGPLDATGEEILRGSAVALGLDAAEVRATAARVSEHAAQVSLLFGATDGADEAGIAERLGAVLAPGLG
jgi:HD-like signal output (HDOD) protein